VSPLLQKEGRVNNVPQGGKKPRDGGKNNEKGAISKN